MATVSGSENILFHLHLAHARSLRAAVGACQPLTHDWSAGDEWAATLRAHLELAEELARLYTAEYERAVKDFSRDAADLRYSREALENLIASCAEAIRLVGELIEKVVQQTGQYPEGSARLVEAASSLARLQARLAEEWPVCNLEELNAARAQIERGEALDLDETFARIAGVDRAAWLERVAVQQRKSKDG